MEKLFASTESARCVIICSNICGKILHVTPGTAVGSTSHVMDFQAVLCGAYLALVVAFEIQNAPYAYVYSRVKIAAVRWMDGSGPFRVSVHA